VTQDDHLCLFVAHVANTEPKKPNLLRWVWMATLNDAADHATRQYGHRALMVQTCWQFWGTG
jgi:hypothetical protein